MANGSISTSTGGATFQASWTFSSNGNRYYVNYEGGYGNDLTLTIVRSGCD